MRLRDTPRVFLIAHHDHCSRPRECCWKCATLLLSSHPCKSHPTHQSVIWVSMRLGLKRYYWRPCALPVLDLPMIPVLNIFLDVGGLKDSSSQPPSLHLDNNNRWSNITQLPMYNSSSFLLSIQSRFLPTPMPADPAWHRTRSSWMISAS